MNTFFSVANQDLERLSPQAAVDFFRDLLYAEATSLGIGRNLINVPSAITVRDGGVDTEVRDTPAASGQGIIKQGLTRYQIKTGKFSLQGDREIKGILLNSADELKPRVKSCLDQDGTLVIVLFGWDNPETNNNQLIEKFKATLSGIDPKYKDAKIEMWRQNQLINFIKPFPSLALRLTGRESARFQSHQSWSRDAEMAKPFKAGQQQQDFISKIHKALRTNDAAVHLRVLGEAGIGKTRLVLEGLDVPDLNPLVLYCDNPSKFRDSVLMNEILKEDNNFFAVLVIDECDQDARSYIWDKLKNLGPRVKLISIHNEFETTGGNTLYVETPQLDRLQVSQIIQDYDIPKDEADRWTDLCSGSPRVAHVIGCNLKNNPEDLLKPPDTVNIWGRYVICGDDLNSQEVRQRMMVLRHIELFKRFGFERPLLAEAKVIAELVRNADPLITWPRFQEIIRGLRDRKILQGESTLYITPKALHIKLWIEWWDYYGQAFSLPDFIKNLGEPLTSWFYEMFKYSRESRVASQIVKELLGVNGVFRDEK